jgi:two-component system response regulator DesR
MIRLLLADANSEVRQGLAEVLAQDPEILVGETLSALDDLADAVRRHAPDVVVVAGHPGGLDPVAWCRRLAGIDPRIRPVVALGTPKPAPMLAALGAGARAVVLSDSPPPVLRTAVRTVASGWPFVDPRLAGRLIQVALNGQRLAGLGGLTTSELRVVERLLLGLTDTEIGEQLGMDEDAVDHHVREAARKLGARERQEAGTIARREGLL